VAQHDYVIANGTGAAVRSDLNNALAAIVSNNSGATEPATMYAYQWWADTSTGLLKLRNAANNAWITLFQLDGEWSTLAVENGTAAAPSIYFKDSGTDTGFYSSGTDALDFTTAGTRRLGISSSGDITVYGGNTTLNAQGDLRFADSDSSNWVAFQAPATVSSNVTWTLPSADGTSGQALTTNGSGTLSWASAAAAKISVGNTEAEVVDTGVDGHFKVTTEGTERLRVDSSGRVGLGTSTATLGGNAFRMAILGTKTYSELIPRDGLAIADNTATAQGVGGSITLHGIYDGSGNYTAFAGIEGQKENATSGNYAGALVLKSRTNFGNLNEALRIDSSQRLLVGTSTSLGAFYNTASSVNHLAQIETTGNYLQSWVNHGSFGAHLTIGRSRGSSAGSTTVVQNGDSLGHFSFQGADGSEFVEAAQIRAEVDGAPGANDMPGRLLFLTTADGASSPTERMRIASGGRVSAPSWYDETTASAANVNVASTGILQRSTSSIKYKTDVETIEDSYSDALLNCRPVWYRSTCANDNPAYGWWGFIAEEVAEIDPRLCFFEQQEDGRLEPEGVAYDRFVPHLLNLIKRQGEAIAELQAEVAALKGA
jgi:hypothetical protein